MEPPPDKKRNAVAAHKAFSKKTKRSVPIPPEVPEAIPPVAKSDEITPRSLWLDALPQDVCSRIAAYVTHDRDSLRPEFPNEDALALAETSEKQRNAMAEALDQTPDLRFGDLKKWLQVFENPTYIDAREGRGVAVLDLLSRPSLRSAQISNRANHLSAIAAGNSVVELSIHLARLTDARYKTMVDALKKLTTLVSLTIQCDPARACAFECTIDGPRAYERLAVSCPHLMALHMHCQCDTEVDHSPVVYAFPALKEITVTKPLPEDALAYMRSRESVILQSHRASPCLYASEIGAAVTAIKFPEPKWSNYQLNKVLPPMAQAKEKDVALLKKCPDLRELDLLLQLGAEKELSERKLLISLQLYWSFEERGFEEERWLLKPLDGALVRRVFAQPLLQRLALVGAAIEMEDLEVVLRTAGTSLEELIVSLTGQPEAMTDRLIRILDAVTLYNEKLQILRAIEPDWKGSAKVMESISKETRDKRKKFVPLFLERVRKLQRKNPWFDKMTLQNSIDKIFTHF